jgi:hypothetical protein
MAIVRIFMLIENARAIPSNEPGFGIAWNWDAIGRLRTDGKTHVVAKAER